MKVLLRILVRLCNRYRRLVGQILEVEEAHAPPPEEETPTKPPFEASAGESGCSFDYVAYLPILPFFQDFDARDIALFNERSSVHELPRGVKLIERGRPGTTSYLVVRGAVSTSATHDGVTHRLGLLGPGRIAGLNAMIEGGANTATYRVRVGATLVRLARDRFLEIVEGNSRASLSLLNALSANLVLDVAQATSELTRRRGLSLFHGQLEVD